MIEYPLMREEDLMGKRRDRPGTMQRRVLILDGDPASRRQLQEMLEEMGFDVVVTSDASTTLVLLSAEQKNHVQVDGILLDLLTPGTDRFLRELREQFPDLPVLMMGEARHIDQLRASLETGAMDFVLKPIEPDVLRRKCFRTFLY